MKLHCPCSPFCISLPRNRHSNFVLPQAQRRLKQQQAQAGRDAAATSGSDFSSRLGAIVAIADGALRDMQVGFAKTSGSEAAVAQMMCAMQII